MLNSKKVRLLEIARENGALTLNNALDIYSHRSSASRSVKQLVENDLLEERKPPRITSENKVWTLTGKSEALLD